MTELIVETDLGHDPDDFFAICYLAAIGVKIKSILISPGDPDQVAIAKFLCKELGLNIPVGVARLGRDKTSSLGVHADILNKYKFPLRATHDGLGSDLLKDLIDNDTEVLVIGPVEGVGEFLSQNPERTIKKATMQGGFLSYDLHQYDCVKIDKFENTSWQPTFNLNGNRKAGLAFLSGNILERRMVGKNVCHTVVYDKNTLNSMTPAPNRAAEIFLETMTLYLDRHDNKKFHDPTAAVCHLYPNIGNWVRGKTIKMESGWGTVLDDNGDHILASINYDLLWEHITQWK